MLFTSSEALFMDATPGRASAEANYYSTVYNYLPGQQLLAKWFVFLRGRIYTGGNR